MIPKSSYLCPWGNGTIGERGVGHGWLGWSFSCLAFVFLFLLTYPRLTLIITGKKFFLLRLPLPLQVLSWFTDSFRIAIVPIAYLVYKSRQLSRMWPFSLLHKVVSSSYMPHVYIKTLWYHTRSLLHQNSPDSLRTSSLGCSGGGAGKGRRACNYICLWSLNICIEKVNVKCWLEEMSLVMASFFNVCSRSRSFPIHTD